MAIEFVLICEHGSGRTAELGRYEYCREAEASAQAYHDQRNRSPRVAGASFAELLTWQNDDATGCVRAGDAGISYTIKPLTQYDRDNSAG